MAINKTVFEAAGAMQYVDAENHTWTTDNFLKAVQPSTDSGNDRVRDLLRGQGGDQAPAPSSTTCTAAPSPMQPTPSTPLILPKTSRQSRPCATRKASTLTPPSTAARRSPSSATAPCRWPSAGTLPSRPTLTTAQPARPTAATTSCSWRSRLSPATPHCAAASGASACLTTATRTRSLPPRPHQLHGQL